MRFEEIRKIKDLYKLYGFSEERSNNNLLIFTYSNGYFYNAEIICLENRNDLEIGNIKTDYENDGFSVRILNYSSYEDLHNMLFKGFFGTESVNERLIREYEEFCKLQSEKLFDSSYEYVEPSYLWNNETNVGKLIDNIALQINQEGAQLIILEAAAGYGKTCTSYELINKMARTGMPHAPIFTELSKNRRATLFRYVLLDEIDRKFTRLSSQLVTFEIQNGRVPLIIDGFDELISRSNQSIPDKNNSNDEDSQTMLDTIADLFKSGCYTKVVLTSRKSAIFTGDIFNEWVQNRLPECNVTRISIEEPTIQDWLGSDKVQILKNQRIPFASIVNPILLAFMRSMDIEKFREKCSNVEDVITYYFNSLLNRERGRQSLLLKEEEQYESFKSLAKDFIEFDIVSEELTFIRDLFLDIIHSKFNEYRERYLMTEEKPTEEELAMKLAGHALLNRISPMKNQVGFVNDFVFGIFIGELMISNKIDLTDMDPKYIDIACTAYASRSNEKKEELLKTVLPHIRQLNYEQQLDIELKLTSTILQNYNDHYFSNRSFNQDVFFDGAFYFQNCTFKSCTFNRCYLVTNTFKNCSFYDCKFYEIVIERNTVHNCELVFGDNCIGHEEFAQLASYEEPIETDENYEIVILKKYRLGGINARFLRDSLPEKVLLTTHSPEARKKLELALENLKKREILYKDSHSWIRNKEKTKEVKDILGM